MYRPLELIPFLPTIATVACREIRPWHIQRAASLQPYKDLLELIASQRTVTKKSSSTYCITESEQVVRGDL